LIRAATPAELPFIRETCCKVRWPRPWMGEGHAVSWDAWLREHGPVVDRWLRDGDALVFCQDDVPDLVLGFSVVTHGQLMCLYVKRDFRGHGIGRALVDGTGVLYGQQLLCYRPTSSLRHWARHHGFELVESIEQVVAA